MEIPDEM